MENTTEQPSSSIPNKRNSTLAKVSVILGVLGFALPCLAFYILAFPGSEYLITNGKNVHEALLLSVYIPVALWIAGPIAIIVGFISLQKRDLDGISATWKKTAKAGIALGILTIPCVLLPLILWLGFVNACAQGC